MIQFWGKYKQIVLQNCTDPQLSETELDYWRNILFATAVLYILPLSFIAIVPGMYMAYNTGLYTLFVADILVLLILVMIALYPGLTVSMRKLLFCFGLYLVSSALLYSLGSFGPGLLYLLGSTFFITLIFEKKIAWWSVYLNIVICSIFGFMIYYETIDSIIIQEYRADSWFAVSANLIFLSIIAVLLVPHLFEGLHSAFKKRDQLQDELISKQRDLEESLELVEDKNRELEQFAYTASHDLKEPLRMIQGFMDLLKRNYDSVLDSRAQKYIHFAMDGANRMGNLIDDLLEYSRVGRVHNEKEEINLNEMVKSLVSDDFLFTDEAKPIVHINNLPVITGVPVTLNMLFKNLISNAVKYQKENNRPEITITAEEEGRFWHFSVSDNGIGIGEEYFDSVFVLFKRLHTTDEYPGSGMGLAICKKIVEQHGGNIWVESEPGQGSTFYFTIEKGEQT